MKNTIKIGHTDIYETIETRQVDSSFINKIVEEAIIQAEDSTWYDYADKETCLHILYRLKDVLKDGVL